MKNQVTTILLSVIITIAVIGAIGFFFMPTIATNYMIQAHHGGDASGMNAMREMMMGEAVIPEDADFSQTRTSTTGAFVATWKTESGTPPLNSLHSWTLRLENADGSPVEGAAITISGGMPQHGHGLPTQPQVTKDLGNGEYLVEGMKFQMPGYWQVTFSITADTTDSVMFELNLQ